MNDEPKDNLSLLNLSSRCYHMFRTIFVILNQDLSIMPRRFMEFQEKISYHDITYVMDRIHGHWTKSRKVQDGMVLKLLNKLIFKIKFCLA